MKTTSLNCLSDINKIKKLLDKNDLSDFDFQLEIGKYNTQILKLYINTLSNPIYNNVGDIYDKILVIQKEIPLVEIHLTFIFPDSDYFA